MSVFTPGEPPKGNWFYATVRVKERKVTRTMKSERMKTYTYGQIVITFPEYMVGEEVMIAMKDLTEECLKEMHLTPSDLDQW